MPESQSFYMLVIYVPQDSADAVKAALFAAGAGRIGHYDSCCWQTLGVGQFRPLAGSQPALGKHDEVEQVDEIKIEVTCDQTALDAALEAMRAAHPYETPAFHYYLVNG